PPAGYRNDQYEPGPWTMRPKGPLLEATWRPFLHVPIDAAARTRSGRANSSSPDVPSGCQRAITPRQSSVTSWKPFAVFVRMISSVVVEYVGSVKKTYFERNCAVGRSGTKSSS